MEDLQNVLLEAEELPAAPSWEKLKKAPEPFSELSLHDYQLVAALEGDAPVESLPLNEPATASDWKRYQLARLQSGKEAFPYKSRLRRRDRKCTRLNSSHVRISYAVFCLKKKNTNPTVMFLQLAPSPLVLIRPHWLAWPTLVLQVPLSPPSSPMATPCAASPAPTCNEPEM